MFVDPEQKPSRAESFPALDAFSRAEYLVAKGVSILVCGAISSDYEEEIARRGIEIVSFIAGPVDQVVEAWRDGRLVSTRFSMPGCGCPRRRCRRRGYRVLSGTNGRTSRT